MSLALRVTGAIADVVAVGDDVEIVEKAIAATYGAAHAAGTDAGNRSMVAGGRTAWSADDYNAAARTHNAVYPVAAHVRAGHQVRSYQRRAVPSTRAAALAYLGKRDSRRSPRGSNATLYREAAPTPLGGHGADWGMPAGGDIHYRLHNTDIATFHEDDSMTLRTGGWHTKTTQAHLNKLLDDRGRVEQKNFEWIYRPQRSAAVPFAEGMRIDALGNIVTGDATKSVRDAVMKSLDTPAGIGGIALHLREVGEAAGIQDLMAYLGIDETLAYEVAAKALRTARKAEPLMSRCSTCKQMKMTTSTGTGLGAKRTCATCAAKKSIELTVGSGG